MASVAEPEVENLKEEKKESKRPRPIDKTIKIAFATEMEARENPPQLKPEDGGGSPKDWNLVVVTNNTNGKTCFIWARTLDNAIAYVASNSYAAKWLEGGHRGRVATKIDETVMMLLKMAFAGKDKGMVEMANKILTDKPQYRLPLIEAGLIAK